MLVGKKNIDLARLRTHANSVSSLNSFVMENVPRLFRHIDAIVNNQKYLTALQLRRIESISYTRRKELCDGLLKGVTVTGVINIIVDVEDLFMECDMNKLLNNLLKGEEDGVSNE